MPGEQELEFAVSAIESDTPVLPNMGADQASVYTGTVQAGPIPARRRGYRPRSTRGARLISPIIVLIAWQLTHVFKLVSETKLPPPSYLVTTAYNLIFHATPAFGSLQDALLQSLERFALGFFIGGSIGVSLAVISALSRTGEAAVDPLLQMVRTVPLFGLVPVFIIWFGIGVEPKIMIVALAAAVPLYLNTYAGIRAIDGRLFELGKVLNLSRREIYKNVVFPGALPTALVGLRQSTGAALLALVVAEQINASGGLGFMINQADQFGRNDVILVALLVYTILGLLTDWIVRILERRALAWRTDLVIR